MHFEDFVWYPVLSDCCLSETGLCPNWKQARNKLQFTVCKINCGLVLNITFRPGRRSMRLHLALKMVLGFIPSIYFDWFLHGIDWTLKHIILNSRYCWISVCIRSLSTQNITAFIILHFHKYFSICAPLLLGCSLLSGPERFQKMK